MVYEQDWCDDDVLWAEYQQLGAVPVETHQRVSNPDVSIRGGRAVAGTAGGIVVANLVAAAWARLKSESWDPNRLKGGFSDRAWYAGMLTASSTLATFLAAPTGARARSALGCMAGNIVAQAPLLLSPDIAENNPEVVHAWQSLLPMAGVTIASNL